MTVIQQIQPNPSIAYSQRRSQDEFLATQRQTGEDTGRQIFTPLTFIASDATPDVSLGRNFISSTTGVTITDFDGGVSGQEIRVISGGATVYDTTSTNLSGSSVNITTAAGDTTMWLCEDGTTWRLLGYVDISVDNSAGA